MACACVVRSFWLFLKKPRITNSGDTHPPFSPSTITAVLLGLSLLVTAICALLALPFLLKGEAEPGDHLRVISAGSIPSLVLAMVVLGPLTEEVLFRGWLSGTWRSLVSSALFAALVFRVPSLIDGLFSISATLVQSALVIAGLIVFRVLSPIDAGNRLPYFEKAFPSLFWMQGVVFGALHYQNVSTSSPIVTILYVVPLVLCGWFWGFARVRVGLWSAVLLHAAYNVPAVVGMLAFMAILG